ERPVSFWLDTESGNGPLFRLQRRRQSARIQPLHRPTGTGVASQCPHVLYQNVISITPRRRNLRDDAQEIDSDIRDVVDVTVEISFGNSLYCSRHAKSVWDLCWSGIGEMDHVDAAGAISLASGLAVARGRCAR